MSQPGTHQGKLSDEHRKRQQAKHARNRSRSGQEFHSPCNSYATCTHKKHGYTKAWRHGTPSKSGQRSRKWPKVYK